MALKKNTHTHINHSKLINAKFVEVFATLHSGVFGGNEMLEALRNTSILFSRLNCSSFILLLRVEFSFTNFFMFFNF